MFRFARVNELLSSKKTKSSTIKSRSRARLNRSLDEIQSHVFESTTSKCANFFKKIRIIKMLATRFAPHLRSRYVATSFVTEHRWSSVARRSRYYSSTRITAALRAENVRYAVLLDAENAQHSKMPLIMEEVAQFGSAAVRRVYGDFSKPNLLPWRKVSLDQSFRPVNAFNYVPGKG